MADTGLLDFFASPEGQGLLAAGFGALGSRSTLGGISRGGLLGLQAYGQASDRQAQLAQQDKHNKMLDIQLQQAQQAQQDQQDLRGLAQQFYRGPAMTMDQVNAAPGAAGPTNARAELIPQTQGSFDSQGFLNAYMAKDPLKAMQLRSSMAKELPFNKIDPKDFTSESVARFAQTGNYGDLVAARKKDFAPNGQVVDLYSAQPGQAYSDPNKPFMTNSQGQAVPNLPFQSFELSKAKAGAPSVSVKNDIKTGESLAGQIGPMVKDSYIAAQGAVQTADAADRIVKAIDSGKVIAGPMANGRLTAMQVGDMIGIGGKDAQEKIANTRQAIRGLAELTLQGRKQMTDQGAITESEGKLAERAMSGDITMTAGEIKQLANASRRAAQFIYNQHQAQLKNMRERPDLAGMADFYNVAPFPAGGAGQQQSGATFLGFE